MIYSAPRKVFLLQKFSMMQFMAGNDVGESAHADFVFIGDAATHPIFGAKITEKRQGCYADRCKFRGQIRETAIGERAVVDVVVLLEAFYRRLIAASDAQGSVRENPLAVGDVTEQLLDTPFSRRIAQFAVRFAKFGKQQCSLPGLVLERLQDRVRRRREMYFP